MHNVFIPLDLDAEIERRHRNLPHWVQDGCSYFVTFRTADSLPQTKLQSLGHEREAWLRAHPAPWNDAEREEYHDRFVEEAQRWLDAGHGACPLRNPVCSRTVANALRFFDGERYVLDQFVVMPNHVHAIVKPIAFELKDILHSWKSFTALQINRSLRRKGTLWQQDTFDHIVRSWEHVEYFRRYIRENPAKAGLRNGEALIGSGKIGLVRP